MLVRCPQCGVEFRITDYDPAEPVIKYLCPGCNGIVNLDLEKDEIQSSSSATHFKSLERRKSVLVADDTRSIRETARLILTAAGFDVLMAVDGVEAINLIKEHHPDLILLDLLMPNKTGFDVLEEVLKDETTASTPVIVMSAVYKENVVEFLQQKGVQGFLDKGQIGQTLVFRVRQILEPESDS
jgi:CheY-like chemotaxis protein